MAILQCSNSLFYFPSYLSPIWFHNVQAMASPRNVDFKNLIHGDYMSPNGFRSSRLHTSCRVSQDVSLASNQLPRAPTAPVFHLIHGPALHLSNQLNTVSVPTMKQGACWATLEVNQGTKKWIDNGVRPLIRAKRMEHLKFVNSCWWTRWISVSSWKMAVVRRVYCFWGSHTE